MTTDLKISTHKLLSGDAYTIGRGVTLGDTETASVSVENPSDSGKTLVVNFQRIQVGAAATGIYYRNSTISGGTPADSVNDMIGSENESVANVTYDATVSDSDTSTTFPLSDASGPTESGLAERPPVAITQGSSLTVEITSNSSDNGILFMFTFYETERGS